MPRVSVVSPAYNHEKYVGQAVTSVLNQTFTDFELIISDDASTDGTVREIEKFNDPRILLLKNSVNIGNTANSYRGWERSSGEYVSWITTDDMYEPHFLKTFVDYLDANPHALGVFGLARFMDDNSNLLSDRWTDVGVGKNRFVHLSQLFRLQHPYCAPAGMIRQSVLKKVGYAPPFLMQTNDYHMFVRMLFTGEMPILDENVLRYRWQANEGNVSARSLTKDSRLDFELFEVIDLFREGIDSIETLMEIFPEVRDHAWPKSDDLISFHLAHVAIKFNYPSHRLYGLHLLYQLMKDEATAKKLRDTCGFTYVDLFRLEGEYPVIMNHALWAEGMHNTLRQKDQEITQLKEQLHSAKKDLSASRATV